MVMVGDADDKDFADDDEKAVTFGQAVRSWTNRC